MLPVALFVHSLSVFLLVSAVSYYRNLYVCIVFVFACGFLPFVEHKGVSSAYFTPLVTASLLSWGYVLAICGLASTDVHVSVQSCIVIVCSGLVFHRLSPFLDVAASRWYTLLGSVLVFPVSLLIHVFVYDVVVFCGVVNLLHLYKLHSVVFHTLPNPETQLPAVSVAYHNRRTSVFN
nr:hypothetical protein [Blunervirus sp.]